MHAVVVVILLILVLGFISRDVEPIRFYTKSPDVERIRRRIRRHTTVAVLVLIALMGLIVLSLPVIH